MLFPCYIDTQENIPDPLLNIKDVMWRSCSFVRWTYQNTCKEFILIVKSPNITIVTKLHPYARRPIFWMHSGVFGPHGLQFQFQVTLVGPWTCQLRHKRNSMDSYNLQRERKCHQGRDWKGNGGTSCTGHVLSCISLFACRALQPSGKSTWKILWSIWARMFMLIDSVVLFPIEGWSEFLHRKVIRAYTIIYGKK